MKKAKTHFQHYYSYYGLVFNSELPLNLPTTSPAKADVTVRYHQPAISQHADKTAYQSLPNGLFFTIKNIASFLVTDGQSIEITPKQNVDINIVKLYVLGMCTAAILRYRGFLVFHGTSIVFKEHAILLLGQKGAGKSSLAAALQQKGCAILCDDIAPIQFIQNKPTVKKGLSHVKLMPDTMNAIGLPQDDNLYKRIAKNAPKRKVSFDTAIKINEHYPLKTIIVLDWNGAKGLQKLAGADCFLSLTMHLFFSQLRKNVNSEIDKNEFNQCAQIASVTNILAREREASPAIMVQNIEKTLDIINELASVD